MKPTADLSKKTKAGLIALAKRKKIPVTSGMLKDTLVKAIKKGLRKIEAQKKSKTATAKKKSAPTSKAKTGRKPKSIARKKAPGKSKAKKTPAKKSTTAKSKTTGALETDKIQTPSTLAETPPDLPERYNDHSLMVLARDPNWAFAYWDLNPTKVRNLLKSAGQSPAKARWILRVYSAALHPTEEKGHYFDVDVIFQGGNYYLNLSKPGARFIVEIGVMDTSGLFRSTAQSNAFIMPVDHPAETIAPESTFSPKSPMPRLGGSSPDGSGSTKPPSSGSH